MEVNEHQFSLTWWFLNPSNFPWLGFSNPSHPYQNKIWQKRQKSVQLVLNKDWTHNPLITNQVYNQFDHFMFCDNS